MKLTEANGKFPELKAYKTIYTKTVWNEKYKKYLEEEISNLD